MSTQQRFARLIKFQARTEALTESGFERERKQGVTLGAKQKQTFTFIPHATFLAALRTKCPRCGIEFIETEESYASKKDHRASEPMGPKPEAYRQLESRCTYGSLRSSMGIVLHSDVTAASGSVEK